MICSGNDAQMQPDDRLGARYTVLVAVRVHSAGGRLIVGWGAALGCVAVGCMCGAGGCLLKLVT